MLVILYSITFVGGFAPMSVDGGGMASAPLTAAIIDLVLLGLFAVQHTIMARPAFKAWWTKLVSPAIERSTFVLAASLVLILLFWQWRPITTTIWRVEGWPAATLIAICGLGWLIGLTSTYLIDHFELFGLRQVFGKETRVSPFKTPLLYRLVRHPLMSGLLLAFWATPHMTAGHLLFAVLNTAYILVGVRFEERDLVTQFGDRYEHYRQRVPMLVPSVLGVSDTDPWS